MKEISFGKKLEEIHKKTIIKPIVKYFEDYFNEQFSNKKIRVKLN